MTPIHKSGDPRIKDSYRGITITSCLGKVFNSILNSRLEIQNYLQDKSTDLQIGYKQNSRTSDHLFILKSLINKTVNCEKQKLYTCFVDFGKAFDTVPQVALLLKLVRNGIDGNFYRLIKDMYNKTSLTVKVDGHLSLPFASGRGVRQGDNLSPNLFKIFINDLP